MYILLHMYVSTKQKRATDKTAGNKKHRGTCATSEHLLLHKLPTLINVVCICACTHHPVWVDQAVQHEDEAVGGYGLVALDPESRRLRQLSRRSSPQLILPQVRSEQTGGGARDRRQRCHRSLTQQHLQQCYNSSKIHYIDRCT